MSLANVYQQLVALNIWILEKSSKLFLTVGKPGLLGSTVKVSHRSVCAFVSH